jgi:hypothetical protein
MNDLGIFIAGLACGAIFGVSLVWFYAYVWAVNMLKAKEARAA